MIMMKTLNELNYDLRDLYGSDYNLDEALGVVLAQAIGVGTVKEPITIGDLVPMCQDIDVTLNAFSKRYAELGLPPTQFSIEVDTLRVKDKVDDVKNLIQNNLLYERVTLASLGREIVPSALATLQVKIQAKGRLHSLEAQLERLSKVDSPSTLTELLAETRALITKGKEDLAKYNEAFVESFTDPGIDVEKSVLTALIVSGLQVTLDSWMLFEHRLSWD